MIEVDARVATRKIDKLADELGYISSGTFLRGLGLKMKGERALSFLQAHFPASSKGTASLSSRNEFGMPLEKGFFVEAFTSGSKLGFFIGNHLASNDRAQVVLDSLDKGSRAHTVDYSDPLHFLGDAAFAGKSRSTKAKMLWFTLAGNVQYPARKGADYTDKTREFITNVILGEVKAEFSYKVQQRMKRVR